MVNMPMSRSRGKQPAPQSSPYTVLGLSDLPFPTEPVIRPQSTDPRENGAIYAQGPVKIEIQKFEQLLTFDFPNRNKIATLWSRSDVESGRGMGKTALLRFFQSRINSDWGATEFDGQYAAAVIYVSFPEQVGRYHMEQLAWSALIDICRNNVLDAARMFLRYQNMTKSQVDSIIQVNGDENYANLLNDDVLVDNGASPDEVNSAVHIALMTEGIGNEVARSLAEGYFEDYLRGLRRDHNIEPYYVPRITSRSLALSRTLLFNDVVNYLRAGGFDGGYLFIDDIENLVDQMTRRQRLEFAKEFGLCTVRPGYANTTHSFFSSVLTTHQQTAAALSQAWNESGMGSMIRLDPRAPTSVELPLPSQDQAHEIIIAHLDYFRIAPDDTGSINPFTQDGLDALVGKSQHPRALLMSAANVVRQAAGMGVSSINAGFVNQVLDGEGAETISERDFTSGVDVTV